MTAKALSLSGLTAANKTYNGDVAATINSYGTLSGVINGDGNRQNADRQRFLRL